MTDQAFMAGSRPARLTEASGPRSLPVSGVRVWLVRLFIFSLLIPILIPAGAVLLMPHRLYLLVVFIPLVLMLLTGQAGRLLWPDILIIFATIWASIATIVSAGVVASIQPLGLFAIEFLGAYLVGRVLIRSGAEFRRLVWFLLVVALILVPFALLEAVTHRPILLEMIPNSVRAVYAPERMGMRRAQAVFSHPILFGIFISSCMGLFWFVLRPGLPRMISYLLVTVGAVVSLSTGALISLVVQTSLVTWQTIFRQLKSRWRVFSIVTVLGYVTVDLLSNRTPFHVLVDYASFNSGSAYNRILIWEYGTQNVARNPIFGLGADINNWERAHWMSASADNFWLLLTMQYGLPMIIAFMLAIVLIIRTLAKASLHREVDQNSRAAVLVTLGGLLIAGGTVHFWHAMMAFVMFLFGAGLWVVRAESERAADDSEDPDPHDDDRGPGSDDKTTNGAFVSRYSRFAPRPPRDGMTPPARQMVPLSRHRQTRSEIRSR